MAEKNTTQNALSQNTLSNATEYSVSEISGNLKRLVEDAFARVRVSGEITGYRGPHSSGHAYFALKDNTAKLDVVVWKRTFEYLKYKPIEGEKVVALGKITTFPNSSKYQLIIESLEPAGGIGALMAMLEERKKRLASEGLFEQSRKKPIPFMPKIIGVVTSPTGAVIEDIIHRIFDRFKTRIVVWPVRVQGETCGNEVAAGILGFNKLAKDLRLKVDVIIVARGGGSLEDLFGFNDEVVVRAVAASHIPVISGVGHEPDVTLIDYVADYRASTPTAAAERAVPVRRELEDNFANKNRRLQNGMFRFLEIYQQKYKNLARNLPNPEQFLALPRQRYDNVLTRFERAFHVQIAKKRQSFALASRALSLRLIENIVQKQQRNIHILSLHFEQKFKEFIRAKRHDYYNKSLLISPQFLQNTVRNGFDKKQNLTMRLAQNLASILMKKQQNLALQTKALDILSYQNILQRGFALVLDDNNAPIKNAKALPKNGKIQIQFYDDTVTAMVQKDEPLK